MIIHCYNLNLPDQSPNNGQLLKSQADILSSVKTSSKGKEQIIWNSLAILIFLIFTFEDFFC